MPAQLPADRRRGPSQPAGDLADAESSFAQGGDPLSFQQGQVPARASRLGQPSRWEPAVLPPPPVAGLAPDAQQLAGGDRADAGVQQLPVLGLDIKLSFAAPPSHSHTPSPTRSVATSRGTRPSPEGQLSTVVDKTTVT